MNAQVPTATFISFEHTLPVPVVSPGFLLSRESIATLFSDPGNQIRWAEDGSSLQINWVEPGYDWEDDEAETMNRVMLDGVEMFSFTSCPYEFSYDTEDVTALGYAAKWVPGEGFVLSIPNTTPEQAAERLIKDIDDALAYGKFMPQHISSWAEYSSAMHALDRIFYFVGIASHETAKKAAVAEIVNAYLWDRAFTLPTEGTVRADQIKMGDKVTGETVRYDSWSPVPEIHMVSEVAPQVDGNWKITFMGPHGRDRTLTVNNSRLFIKA
jgi:hypothetical protein